MLPELNIAYVRHAMERVNTMGNLRYELTKLVHEFEDEANAAFNLWTWLPSYREAQKNHGNYADQFRPTISDIMIEASIFISLKCEPTPEGLVRNEHFHCPCGEYHDGDDDETSHHS